MVSVPGDDRIAKRSEASSSIRSDTRVGAPLAMCLIAAILSASACWAARPPNLKDVKSVQLASNQMPDIRVSDLGTRCCGGLGALVMMVPATLLSFQIKTGGAAGGAMVGAVIGAGAGVGMLIGQAIATRRISSRTSGITDLAEATRDAFARSVDSAFASWPNLVASTFSEDSTGGLTADAATMTFSVTNPQLTDYYGFSCEVAARIAKPGQEELWNARKSYKSRDAHRKKSISKYKENSFAALNEELDLVAAEMASEFVLRVQGRR